jgi:hypothetical protein
MKELTVNTGGNIYLIRIGSGMLAAESGAGPHH